MQVNDCVLLQIHYWLQQCIIIKIERCGKDPHHDQPITTVLT